MSGVNSGDRVVIDASVAVKWFLPESEVEQDVDRALHLLQLIRSKAILPVQPPHWLAEVAAVITRIRPAIAQEATELLVALDLPIQEGLETYRHAVQIAADLEHHLFDTLYHAVAVEREIVLVSADEHYCREAKRIGHIEVLGAWQPPA